jgi:chromosome segregation ATPase
MGLFNKRADEIERLRSEIAAMGARLDAATAAESALGGQVEQLSRRLRSPLAPPPEDPPALARAAELDELRGRVEQLVERLETVDARITAISTELANQIEELSGELDGRAAGTPPTDEVVDELRDAQTRLASEQARYQIAFRQDLADLADRLRRH